MEPTITIKDPEHLGELLRSIVDGLEERRKQKPTLHVIEIPYAFIVDGKPVNHMYDVWVEGADSFEDAKRKALNEFSSRVMEGIRNGYYPIIRVYHDRIRQRN